ncbi:hypothetical protein ACO2Q3_21480 [Caulobacter sp. KR2-114]|uniref:hypothetical protein n=1 Tax=Caulobacter sp. KR2-114 TaxID=3400912 RepID=UPI003C098C6C
MALADNLHAYDNAALGTLRDNAERLAAGPDGQRQRDAATLLPLIEAELAARVEAKPAPVKVARRKAPARTSTAA